GADLPRASEVNLDGRVLAFTCIVAVLTGIVAGIAPAWRMTKGDANDALKQGLGRGGSQAGERRVRHVLVTAEVALALVLLQGGGSTQPVAIAGRPPAPLSEQPEVPVRVITPQYVSAVRMQVLDGRDFIDADTPERPLAVLVSASMARRFWPNERPVGKHLM